VTIDLDPLVRVAVDTFKQTKEDAARHHGADPGAMVGVYRGGELLATVNQGDGAGAVIAEMCRAAVLGFRAEAVTVMTDSYRLESTRAENLPAWANIPGEIGRRWERGQRDGLTECLTIFAMSAADTVMVTEPYVRKGRKVNWTGSEEIRQPKHVGGHVADSIRIGFGAQDALSVQVNATAVVMAIDDTELEACSDVAAILALGRLGCAVAYCGPLGDQVAEYLADHPELHVEEL
jgi:hypothetical protein